MHVCPMSLEEGVLNLFVCLPELHAAKQSKAWCRCRDGVLLFCRVSRVRLEPVRGVGWLVGAHKCGGVEVETIDTQRGLFRGNSCMADGAEQCAC